MGEFFRGLGKLIQDLLDKIRRPKKQEYESISSIFGTTYTGTKEFNTVDKNGFVEIPSHADVNFELVYDEDQLINSLEKYFSISRTLLPKRIEVKTLILTLAANQQSDYQAVDLSQYEERGLAHYIVGRTTGLKELMDEYLMEQIYDSEEEAKEEQEWLAEELKQAEESGIFSSIVGKATLLHYEELGIWSFELEDEDE
jgi:hypothetical protein